MARLCAVTTSKLAVPFSQIVALKAALQKLHFAGWGQLYAQTVSTPINTDWLEPERERAREDLDHAVGGVLVVLLFSIFEADEHWPRIAHKDGYFSTRDKERFLAFRHIRHSIAHAPDGGRAVTHAAEFDKVMNSSAKIGGVVNWNDDSIRLSPTIGYECLSLMNQIIYGALQTLYNEAQAATGREP